MCSGKSEHFLREYRIIFITKSFYGKCVTHRMDGLLLIYKHVFYMWNDFLICAIYYVGVNINIKSVAP